MSKTLLAIVELGGYPDFSPLYRELGYEVTVETSVRKAMRLIKQRVPDVVVAEFNFQSDFRDRTSSLESLLAALQGRGDSRVIIFYEQEFAEPYQRLLQQYPVHASLAFPIDEAQLRTKIMQLA